EFRLYVQSGLHAAIDRNVQRYADYHGNTDWEPSSHQPQRLRHRFVRYFHSQPEQPGLWRRSHRTDVCQRADFYYGCEWAIDRLKSQLQRDERSGFFSRGEYVDGKRGLGESRGADRHQL